MDIFRDPQPTSDRLDPQVREMVLTHYLSTAARRDTLAEVSIRMSRRYLEGGPVDPEALANSLDILERLRARLDGTETLDKVALLGLCGDLRALQDRIAPKGV